MKIETDWGNIFIEDDVVMKYKDMQNLISCLQEYLEIQGRISHLRREIEVYEDDYKIQFNWDGFKTTVCKHPKYR
jgi:hypothetical protein